jgi:hypothetical protein
MIQVHTFGPSAPIYIWNCVLTIIFNFKCNRKEEQVERVPKKDSTGPTKSRKKPVNTSDMREA